jgi:hypothetical protein
MAAAESKGSPASYGSGTPSRAQIGGAMKSILAKHEPHRRPWLPMRARQEMQTGGKSRSATWPSSVRTGLRQVVAPEPEGRASALSSTPTMDPMIEPGAAMLEGRSSLTP